MKVENVVFVLVVLALVSIGCNAYNAIDNLRIQFEKENLRRNGHSYTHDR